MNPNIQKVLNQINKNTKSQFKPVGRKSISEALQFQQSILRLEQKRIDREQEVQRKENLFVEVTDQIINPNKLPI